MLPKIQCLALSDNDFGDSFPFILVSITSLKVLDLCCCHLNSYVPIIPNLLDLDISCNDFEQAEYEQLWRRYHLKRMNFMSYVLELNNSTTNMSECSKYAWEWLGLSARGEIPKSLGRMSNLRELHMTYGIGGLFPEFLGNLRSLRVLDWSFNSLAGPLPTFHGKVTHVDLSLNNLNGSVLESLGRLRSLQVLNLSQNNFAGPIPHSLGTLPPLPFLPIN
ncbi:putative non-specific serine/threonine protein kinase [Helianthus debilis subsp. tardiflorus]